MNVARRICMLPYKNMRKNVYRRLQSAAANQDPSASQPQVQDKFDFEDLNVLERVERRKAKISPFMKDIFLSNFNREMLAYPEILNKDESEALDKRIAALENVFSKPESSEEDKKKVLIATKLYAAPVPLTHGGLASNCTEILRYLETISSDLELAQEMSDHWVCLQALKVGLNADVYQRVLGELISGENTISLCVKEKIAERMTQADFRTSAEMDNQGVWRITGQKVCTQKTGYFIVLCLVETKRLKAFLVHPNAGGYKFKDNFAVFSSTPGTPLDEASEEALAKVLSESRLHTATLCRSTLSHSMRACADYVTPRYFAGKPLSELSTIKSLIGETLVNLYASESAEYFTAGLIDGYLEPDAELEMAMCRNFIATRAEQNLLRLLTIPGVEMHDQCTRMLQDLRSLSLRGETVDNVNMFIALNGVHHAGKLMSEEIKAVRNPLFNPSFVFKKMLADRHQEKDQPKLNLYLAEHLHPSLRVPAEQLEYCVVRMRYAAEVLLSRHGLEVAHAYTELSRLAEAASEILAMTAVLARASRSYCIGLRNGEIEMKLAACFVENSRDRVKRLIKEIDDGEYFNLDHFKIQFGKKIMETKTLLVEKPTARVFW